MYYKAIVSCNKKVQQSPKLGEKNIKMSYAVNDYFLLPLYLHNKKKLINRSPIQKNLDPEWHHRSAEVT